LESEAATGSNRGHLRTTVLFWCLCILLLCAKSLYVLKPLFIGLDTLPLLVLFCLPPLILFFSFGFLFKGNAAAAYWIGLSLVLSLLFFADVLYFRAFHHYPSIAVLFNPSPLDGLGSSVASLVRPVDFLLLIDLPILFFVARKDRKRFCQTSKAKLFAIPLILSIVILIGYGLLLNRQYTLANPRYSACYLSPLGFHLYDVYEVAAQQNTKLSEKDEEAISEWFEANRKYLPPASQYADLSGILEDKNLIVIQFESLEAVLLNYSQQGFEITPNLNRLLPESLYFSNVIAQVGDGNSSDAELLFNCSLYPLRKGSAFLLQPANVYNTFPSLLEKEGYRTYALHGDEREYWGRDVVYPGMGYDEYLSEESFDDQRSSGMGLIDESLYDQIQNTIQSADEPYFIFGITLTSHLPYQFSPDIDYMGVPGDGATQDYLRSIQYADACLGEFLDEAEGLNELSNTAVVIYGDHEGIHKYYDETTLPDNNGKVPFIVYIPGFEGIEIQSPGGQVDLFPTLAFLLGLDEALYKDAVMGRNILGGFGGSGVTWEGIVTLDSADPQHLIDGLALSDKMIHSDYFKKHRN
jgi:phosphoglycerol transferase MdoB-like AlkP superfamily enzyme